ncbi:mannitol dehydrogenase family protein [Pseudonocardia sulfidoxydans]|uniref:mannitol dehydrogenase family protein n=1 Tax=Pseudonocardia sulfidoxydans TaxID=54011 RepID=UPI0011BD972F|nr:mannitol dehydrogenase family protein [Pseudonocardia sulfidoxydans]
MHLGVGNFFRAHQAWYTEHAPDASGWGIAAFTGRSPGAAVGLERQAGLYTLLVLGADRAEAEVVSSLSAVHAADDLDALRRYLASDEVAVVTSTVTEAGYRRDDAGGLDAGADDVRADIAALAADPAGGRVTTTPGRLVAGLLARRAAAVGPLALVPCDNLPDNGAALRRVVTDLARLVDPGLVAWIDEHVSFVTTTVDRITPRPTDADRAEVARLTGVDDPQAVVTEPFAEWVLAGDFPAGRPAWDVAGARFVEDVRPFETRKLWLLNGGHSVLAYAGSIRGHLTVAEAIADPLVRDWVEEWWEAAGRHLTLPAVEVAAYRQALLDRFANPRIRHLLAQIAADGSQKVPIRAVPVLLAERAAGRLPLGATRFVAAWIAHLRGHGAPVTDVRAAEIRTLADGPADAAAAEVLTWLGVDDLEVTAMVEQQLRELEQGN